MQWRIPRDTVASFRLLSTGVEVWQLMQGIVHIKATCQIPHPFLDFLVFLHISPHSHCITRRGDRLGSKMLGPSNTYVPLTRANWRMVYTSDPLRWIDQLSLLPINSSSKERHSDSREISALRCPGDSPRLPRGWTDKRLSRLSRDRQSCQNRLSPLHYEAYENRFGRFAR